MVFWKKKNILLYSHFALLLCRQKTPLLWASEVPPLPTPFSCFMLILRGCIRRHWESKFTPSSTCRFLLPSMFCRNSGLGSEEDMVVKGQTWSTYLLKCNTHKGDKLWVQFHVLVYLGWTKSERPGLWSNLEIHSGWSIPIKLLNLASFPFKIQWLAVT